MNPQQGANPALADLADIHLPPAVGSFPWAPGWWLLLLLGLALLVAISAALLLRHRRRAYRRAACTELAALARQPDDSAYAQALNQLLRRVALQSFGAGVAGLSGEAWRNLLLDERLAPKGFSANSVEQMLACCYRPDADLNRRAQLQREAEIWIRRHRRQHV